jgi:hypothetical protein
MKAWFEEKPESRQADKNPEWAELCKDWTFWIDGIPYRVPAGYQIDGASIPRIVWPICGGPTDEINIIGAFAHDPLFLTHAVPFRVANEAARQIWIQAQKSPRMAGIMKMAVSSWFGKRAWRNKPENILEITEARQIIKANGEAVDEYQTLWYPKQTFDDPAAA